MGEMKKPQRKPGLIMRGVGLSYCSSEVFSGVRAGSDA